MSHLSEMLDQLSKQCPWLDLNWPEESGYGPAAIAAEQLEAENAKRRKTGPAGGYVQGGGAAAGTTAAGAAAGGSAFAAAQFTPQNAAYQMEMEEKNRPSPITRTKKSYVYSSTTLVYHLIYYSISVHIRCLIYR